MSNYDENKGAAGGSGFDLAAEAERGPRRGRKEEGIYT